MSKIRILPNGDKFTQNIAESFFEAVLNNDSSLYEKTFNFIKNESLAVEVVDTTCGGNVLHWAVSKGYRGMAQRLIRDFPLLINQTSDNGSTPLLNAVQLGYKDILMDLLLAKADPTIKNSDGQNAFNYPRSNQNQSVMDYFDEYQKQLNSLFNNALKENQYEDAQEYLKKGADINNPIRKTDNQYCFSNLFDAVATGNLEKLNFLIENKANLNVIGGRIGSALHAAIIFGHKDIAEKLIQRGISLILQDESGNTAEKLAETKAPAIAKLIQQKSKEKASAPAPQAIPTQRSTGFVFNANDNSSSSEAIFSQFFGSRFPAQPRAATMEELVARANNLSPLPTQVKPVEPPIVPKEAPRTLSLEEKIKNLGTPAYTGGWASQVLSSNKTPVKKKEKHPLNIENLKTKLAQMETHVQILKVDGNACIKAFLEKVSDKNILKHHDINETIDIITKRLKSIRGELSDLERAEDPLWAIEIDLNRINNAVSLSARILRETVIVSYEYHEVHTNLFNSLRFLEACSKELEKEVKNSELSKVVDPAKTQSNTTTETNFSTVMEERLKNFNALPSLGGWQSQFSSNQTVDNVNFKKQKSTLTLNDLKLRITEIETQVNVAEENGKACLAKMRSDCADANYNHETKININDTVKSFRNHIEKLQQICNTVNNISEIDNLFVISNSLSAICNIATDFSTILNINSFSISHYESEYSKLRDSLNKVINKSDKLSTELVEIETNRLAERRGFSNK